MGELIFLENGGSNIPRSGSITEMNDLQDITPLEQQNNKKNKPASVQKQVMNSHYQKMFKYKRQQNLKPIDAATLETGCIWKTLNLYIEVGWTFQISLTSSGRTPSRTPSLRKSGSADNLLDQDAHSKVSSQTSSESRPRSGKNTIFFGERVALWLVHE